MSSDGLISATQIIEELGEMLNLPDLKLNEHGVAGLIADKQYSIGIEYSSSDSVIHIYSKVMDLSGPLEGDLCRKLLSINAYGNETGGATLAWDEVHHEIILCKRVDMEVASSGYLKNIIEKFIDHVERWRKKLSRGLDSLNEDESNTISGIEELAGINTSDANFSNSPQIGGLNNQDGFLKG